MGAGERKGGMPCSLWDFSSLTRHWILALRNAKCTSQCKHRVHWTLKEYTVTVGFNTNTSPLTFLLPQSQNEFNENCVCRGIQIYLIISFWPSDISLTFSNLRCYEQLSSQGISVFHTFININNHLKLLYLFKHKPESIYWRLNKHFKYIVSHNTATKTFILYLKFEMTPIVRRK